MREARAADHPMVIDAGGLLAPHGVARYALRSDPEGLAEMVSALGYRALAFGENELGAPREGIIATLRALRERRIPSIATNLSCDADARALCEVLVDAGDGISLHSVNDQRMAVLAFLPPDALTRAAPELVAGVHLEAIAEAMPRAVRAAHARGATYVLAVVAVETEAALALAGALPDDARPDSLLVAGAGESLLFARPARVYPALFSAPPHDAVELLIRDGGELRDGWGMLAQPLGNGGITVGEPVLAWIDRIGAGYCEAWGRPLAGGQLARPLDPAGIAELTARIVREESSADVSVLNVGAIDHAWEPAREQVLTASDVYVALEYDEPLVVAEVPASWLSELARHAEEHGLVTPGLARDGDGVRVAERATEPRATYRVVTLRFLATGGDHALPALPAGVVWRPYEGPTLRDVVMEHLDEREERDPRDALHDARDTPEWIVRGVVDGQFSGSSIANPERYDASLLNRTSTVTLGLEIDLRADATARQWSWESQAVLRYRSQWAPSAMMGTAGAFTEAADQIQVRSTAAYRGLRSAPSEWWIPDPYVDLFLESELTEPAGRGWHWLLLRPTLGARFPLTSTLDVKLSLGLQGQALEPGGEADVGLGAQVALRPWDLARVADRHVTVSGTLDFFFLDPGDRNVVQLRGSLDAAYDLVGPLALTIGVRLYVQSDDGRAAGVAVDALAGLRLGWLGRALGP